MNAPPDCSLCPRLVESRVAVVNGKGPIDAEVLIVAQNPGEWEEVLGYPLCEKGWSGRKVRDKLLPLAGLTAEEVRWENIVRCRPPRMPKGGDYPPTAKEVSACRGFLLSTIQAVGPKVIITLGAPALDWFFPDAKLSNIHGQRMEWRYTCNGSGERCLSSGNTPTVGSGQENLTTTDTVSSPLLTQPQPKHIDKPSCSHMGKSQTECVSCTPVIIENVCAPSTYTLEQDKIIHGKPLNEEELDHENSVNAGTNLPKRTPITVGGDVGVNLAAKKPVENGSANIEHEHVVVVVASYHPASATPNRSPKLALVMDHDWKELGRYLGRSRNDGNGSNRDRSGSRDGGNSILGSVSLADREVGRYLDSTRERILANHSDIDTGDNGGGDSGNGIGDRDESLADVEGLGTYSLKSGEEMACILRNAFGVK